MEAEEFLDRVIKALAEIDPSAFATIRPHAVTGAPVVSIRGGGDRRNHWRAFAAAKRDRGVACWECFYTYNMDKCEGTFQAAEECVDGACRHGNRPQWPRLS